MLFLSQDISPLLARSSCVCCPHSLEPYYIQQCKEASLGQMGKAVRNGISTARKPAADLEGRSLLHEKGTQGWRGRLRFLLVWQPKASLSGVCMPSSIRCLFPPERRNELWVGLSLFDQTGFMFGFHA